MRIKSCNLVALSFLVLSTSFAIDSYRCHQSILKWTHPFTHTAFEIFENPLLYKKSAFAKLKISEETQNAIIEIANHSADKRDSDPHTLIAQLANVASRRGQKKESFEAFIMQLRDQINFSRSPEIFKDIFHFSGLLEGQAYGLNGPKILELQREILSDFAATNPNLHASLNESREKLYAIFVNKLVTLNISKSEKEAQQFVDSAFKRRNQLLADLKTQKERIAGISPHDENYAKAYWGLKKAQANILLDGSFVIPYKKKTENYQYRIPGGKAPLHILNAAYIATAPIFSAPELISRLLLRSAGKDLGLYGYILGFGGNLVYSHTLGPLVANKIALFFIAKKDKDKVNETVENLSNLNAQDLEKLPGSERALGSHRDACDIIQDPRSKELLAEQDRIAEESDAATLAQEEERDPRFLPLLHEKAFDLLGNSQTVILKKSERLQMNCELRKSFHEYRQHRKKLKWLQEIALNPQKLSPKQKKLLHDYTNDNLYFRSHYNSYLRSNPGMGEEEKQNLQKWLVVKAAVSETVNTWLAETFSKEEKNPAESAQLLRDTDTRLNKLNINPSLKESLKKASELYFQKAPGTRQASVMRLYCLYALNVVYNNPSVSHEQVGESPEIEKELQDYFQALKENL